MYTPPSSSSPAQPSSVPPSEPSKTNNGFLIGTFVIVVSLGAAVFGFGPLFLAEREQAQLKKTGVPAMAKVMQIEPTGTLYNSQPQVILTLKVDPAEGEDFTAQTKMVINPVYLPQFQPGANVRVFYDANDHSKVAVD